MGLLGRDNPDVSIDLSGANLVGTNLNDRDQRAAGARPLTENPSYSMMAVDIAATDGFRAGAPRQLFEGAYTSSTPLRSYDVTPDGQFIMAKQGTPPDQRVTKLNVVLGWAEELKRRVPISSVPAAATLSPPEPATPATGQ